MKSIRLFEDWKTDSELNEALDVFVKGQMALLGTPQEDIEKFERGFKGFYGG